MAARTLKSQLLAFLKSESHFSESIKFSEDEIICEPCRIAGAITPSFRLADPNLVKKLSKHLGTDSHRIECGWSVERNFN